MVKMTWLWLHTLDLEVFSSILSHQQTEPLRGEAVYGALMQRFPSAGMLDAGINSVGS